IHSCESRGREENGLSSAACRPFEFLLYRSERYFYVLLCTVVIIASPRRQGPMDTENSHDAYRVVGIVSGLASTYAARMECFLNLPTYRAGACQTKSPPPSRLMR